MKRLTILAVIGAIALVGCGDDDDTASTTTAEGRYAAIQDYLYDHTDRLVTQTEKLDSLSERYYDLAKSVDFDYKRLLAEHREETADLIAELQREFRTANPAYEQMEGIVAGVPSLADYDVSIDAGGDKSDAENAVPFTITTKTGRKFEQPGNYFFLLETAIFGTEPRFAVKGVEPDLDGDGKVEFGEALPDADFLEAAASDFADEAESLQDSAKAWKPTDKDVLTAVAVMTPTMSEYFEAWKNSRFIAGSKATEKGFVGASRMQDIADILGGLVLVYDNMETTIERTDPQRAAQTGKELRSLHAFAARLRDEERDGKRFTAADADTLGGEAQTRAENIAGQVSQSAGTMGIELET